MKRAIYLDGRERELARRVFELVRHNLDGRYAASGNATTDMALTWTADEIGRLTEKFDEPAAPGSGQ